MDYELWIAVPKRVFRPFEKKKTREKLNTLVFNGHKEGQKRLERGREHPTLITRGAADELTISKSPRNTKLTVERSTVNLLSHGDRVQSLDHISGIPEYRL